MSPAFSLKKPNMPVEAKIATISRLSVSIHLRIKSTSLDFYTTKSQETHPVPSTKNRNINPFALIFAPRFENEINSHHSDLIHRHSSIIIQ
jgi:hypothetical protein